MKEQKIIYQISGLSPLTLPLVRSIRRKERREGLAASRIAISSVGRGENVSAKKSLVKLGCAVTPQDIAALSVHRGIPKGSACRYLCRFILLHSDTEKNTRDALALANRCRDQFAAEIYSLSPNPGAELLFDSIDKDSQNPSVPLLKLRRIHLARNLIYRNLLRHSMFRLAHEEHGEKIVTIVIVGMDSYGTEMLKACLWCGQMEGYVLRVHVIDPSPDAEERFYLMAPEIRVRNKLPRAGEDYYELDFHTSVNPNTLCFADTLRQIANPSWVFVSLGSDSGTLETAIKVREIYAQQNLRQQCVPMHYTTTSQIPFIQAVIENDDTARLLNQNKLVNYRNEYYDIHATGSISSLCSIDHLCNTELEDLALQAHLKWGDPASFNSHEYNRRSSMATAIHKKYRDALYPTDNILKDIIEHRRWNAYMRSTEGYQFGLIRDDLAKQHNCLVKFDDLGRHEKKKDRLMNQP